MTDTRLASKNPGAADHHPTVPSGAVTRVFEIVNKRGLHARASAKFVQTVEKFDADVRVSRGNETVGGTSIMGLMMLAAGLGSEISVVASGKDKAECLIRERFGEDD
jgi:phosphocarrier protein HPr